MQSLSLGHVLAPHFHLLPSDFLPTSLARLKAHNLRKNAHKAPVDPHFPPFSPTTDHHCTDFISRIPIASSNLDKTLGISISSSSSSSSSQPSTRPCASARSSVTPTPDRSFVWPCKCAIPDPNPTRVYNSYWARTSNPQICQAA
jgi:hypothetical protein